MFDIAICEDDRYQQGELEEMLYAIGRKRKIQLEITVYGSGEDLLEEVRRGSRFDVICMDIELEDMNGINVAEELRRCDKTLQVIYVTQYEGYIKDTFRTIPSGYVVKPVDPAEMEEVFVRTLSWIQDKDTYYRFMCDKLPCKVPLKDIQYFQSSLRQVEIFCDGKSYQIYHKLNEIEKELTEQKADGFLRIHQSYLVNYSHIRRFGHAWVELDSGQILPMSRRQRARVEKMLEGG